MICECFEMNTSQRFYVGFQCKTCRISDFDKEFILIHIFNDHDEHVASNENRYIRKIYYCTTCPFQSKYKNRTCSHFDSQHR